MTENHTEKYYATIERLLDKFDRESRKLAFQARTIPEHEAWRKELRAKLREISGISKLHSCELASQLLESVQMDGYRRDKVVIQTEEGVWMPLYILVPDGMEEKERRPCMVAVHGHGSGGKYAVAGRRDIPAIKEAIERSNYDYGVQFVREGYVVFCPDARGAGERREYWMQGEDDKNFTGSSCVHLNNAAISLGYSLTGWCVWDFMRLVDYIETLTFCDVQRIGCSGFSGGGLQILWLAALDDRIKCTVVSGYFYGCKDALFHDPHCSCNYIPHFMEYADLGDLGALVAPRPLLIESGRQDHLNGERGLDNVTEQLEVTRRAFLLHGAEEKLYHHVFEGRHCWNGEKTYSFVRNRL